MPGLLDIAESTKTVDVNGSPVAVYGVSAKGIAVLLERFPEARKLLTGQSPNFTADYLITTVPDAIASIIAAGCGYPGHADAEAKAASLPVQAQADLLDSILTLTMPQGLGPFMDRLAAFIGGAGAEALSSIQGTNSQAQSKA